MGSWYCRDEVEESKLFIKYEIQNPKRPPSCREVWYPDVSVARREGGEISDILNHCNVTG